MLILLPAPGSTPSSISDWQHCVDYIRALALLPSRPLLWSGSYILKGAYFNIGGAIYIADSDTAISGTQSQYIKITPSGNSASASFVASLDGVEWNQAYSGHYDVSGNLYIFNEYTALEMWPAGITDIKTFQGYDNTRHGIRHFSGSGWWVCPPDITKVLISGVGTGGRGGHGGQSDVGIYGGGGGGGGGGGAYGYRIPIDVIPGNAYWVLIGIGYDTVLYKSYMSDPVITFAKGSDGGDGGDSTATTPGIAGAGGAGGVGSEADMALMHKGADGGNGEAGGSHTGGSGGDGAEGGIAVLIKGGKGAYLNIGVSHDATSGSCPGSGAGGGHGKTDPFSATAGADPTQGTLTIEW